MIKLHYVFALILFLLIFGFRCEEQNQNVDNPSIQMIEVCELAFELNELSGIIKIDENKYLTHNDGGDEPRLYELGSSCLLSNNFILNGGVNKDWEAITQDGEYIYIGDFGNNSGNRTDLGVYKISKTELSSDSLEMDTYLLFNYSDQKTYDSGNSHNYDCEAMVSIEDKILLFTKNRANLRTNVYELDKYAVDQSLSIITDFDTEGLVTDAIYNSEKDQLILLCYNFQPFGFANHIWFINNYKTKGFNSNDIEKYPIDLELQFESIVLENSNSMLIGHEIENGGVASLYKVDISEF